MRDAVGDSGLCSVCMTSVCIRLIITPLFADFMAGRSSHLEDKCP